LKAEQDSREEDRLLKKSLWNRSVAQNATKTPGIKAETLQNRGI
jgi:hypothetical protein